MDCFREDHLPLGKAGLCQADDLISAGWVIPDWFVEAVTAVSLGIKSGFADMGLHTGDSILGLLSLF